MAIHQDYWLNKDEAREWLSNLSIGEKLLHPPPQMEYNKTSPTGDKFEPVVIKEKTNDYVLLSYPNRHAQWDKKLPLKYAFAVRPINSVNNEDDDTIPFPPINNNNKIKNNSNHVSLTFKKKHRRQLHPSTNNNIPEITPPAADKTLFNKLHSIRSQTTTYKPLKHTYAETRSKNERNRNIFKRSSKKKGYKILEEQCKNYQKTRTQIDNRLKQKEEKKQLKQKQKLRYLHNNSQQAHMDNSKLDKRKRDNGMNEIEPPLKRIRLLNSNNNCIDYKKENEILKQENEILKQKLDSLECKSERIKAMNLNELNELKVTMQNKIKLIEQTEKEFIDNTYKCIACMDNSKNISFTDGCSHVALCDKCEQSLKTKCCPICQIPYTNVKKINF